MRQTERKVKGTPHCCCCCVTSLVSNSVRPHRRQPTRLPRPWDSPGKNAGVDCHFLLQCTKVKVKSLSRARLLATPWTAAYQAPLSMGFSRQEYWSGVPLPSPKRDWTGYNLYAFVLFGYCDSHSMLINYYFIHHCICIFYTLKNKIFFVPSDQFPPTRDWYHPTEHIRPLVVYILLSWVNKWLMTFCLVRLGISPYGWQEIPSPGRYP